MINKILFIMQYRPKETLYCTDKAINDANKNKIIGR